MRSLCLILVLAACGDDAQQSTDAAVVKDTAAAPDADPRTTVLTVPVTVNRDLDVLFMIDNSSSMQDKQQNLTANFPSFINVLNQIPGGLPNLHLGVVTSDLGVNGADGTTATAIPGNGGCTGSGDGGKLHGAASVTGKYITDVLGSSGTRMTNYTGTLADAFTAIASVGQSGCSFEQSMEAVKRALSNTTDNAGFLRSSAQLAIVFLTDEDDCSANHTGMFATDTSVYGPLTSFRCTRFGVTCDAGGATPAAMDTAGQKDQCHSNESGTDLTKVADYATYIKSLKPDASSITVAAVAGPAMPVDVENLAPTGSSTAIPTLAHSCTYVPAGGQTQVADPAVRLTELLGNFVGSASSSICQSDLSGPLELVAQVIAARLGTPCIAEAIALPADCVVFDQLGTATTPIPACPASGDCFTIAADATTCIAGDHLKLTVTRTTSPAAGTETVVKCKLP